MILELKDISFSYTDSHGDSFNLLDGINLRLREGKITALIGGNGTGKTTLFNIISGFLKDFKGMVLFDGLRLNALPPHKISRCGIGRLFQGRQLTGDLTLMENMKIASDDMTGEMPFSSIFGYRHIVRAEQAKERKVVSVLTRLFGEGNKYLSMLDSNASALSYGEQRLIAIARLLMGDNRLLLLDEPTSGVNPFYIRMIRQLIRQMVREENMTVLLIEHNMYFVRELADYCAYLNNGKIERTGLTETVLDDKKVQSSYLGL